ncbi:MAG: VanZ family protein [Sphingomonas sp.]
MPDAIHGRHQASGKTLTPTALPSRLIRAAAILLPVAAWGLLAAVFVATVGPMQLRPISGQSVGLERFFAFAVIGGLFGLAYPKRWPLVLALVLGSAAAFELMQHLSPGRHGRLADFAVKAAGGLAGLAAASLVNRRRPGS